MSSLRVERRGPAAILTIDRAEQRNALDGATVAALGQALAELADDDDARVVVLTGAGDRAFCAGGDLKSLRASAAEPNPGAAFTTVLLQLHEYPKPTVARVNGAAFGGGLGLALSCDQCIAVESATFGTPEVGMGLFPWMILPVLQAHLGPKPLADLVLGGTRFDAELAFAHGLVTRVVRSDELDTAANESVERLAAGPAGILRRALPELRAQRLPGLRERLANLAEHFRWNLGQPELAERIAAFLASRSPASS